MTTWKPVPGYEGHYEVSDEGQVRSLRRRVPIILAASVGKRGYRVADLRVGGVRRARYVHQLVLEAFVGPRPGGMITRHLDDNPLNNRLENLRYGTVIENGRDAVRNGRTTRKAHCPQGHPYSGKNVYFDGRSRKCRKCTAAAQRRYQARKAAAR